MEPDDDAQLWVISEAVFTANHLTDSDKQNRRETLLTVQQDRKISTNRLSCDTRTESLSMSESADNSKTRWPDLSRPMKSFSVKQG